MGTVNDLVRKSFIYAQVLAEEPVENLSNARSQRGLDILNEIIRINNIDATQWPIITFETFNLVPNVEDFVLDGWSQLLKVQFLLGTVRYTIQRLDLSDYLDLAGITNSGGIPYISYAQRTPTGFILKLFLKPDTSYQLDVYGYKSLTQFSAVTDDITGIPEFYQDYFTYKLASRLQSYYRVTPYTDLMLTLADLERRLKNIREERIDVYRSAVSGMGSYSDVYDRAVILSLTRGYWP